MAGCGRRRLGGWAAAAGLSLPTEIAAKQPHLQPTHRIQQRLHSGVGRQLDADGACRPAHAQHLCSAKTTGFVIGFEVHLRTLPAGLGDVPAPWQWNGRKLCTCSSKMGEVGWTSFGKWMTWLLLFSGSNSHQYCCCQIQYTTLKVHYYYYYYYYYNAFFLHSSLCNSCYFRP